MELILKKINNSYLLEGGYGCDFIIDGVLIKNLSNGWFDEKPKSIRQVIKKKEAVGYGDLSKEEYEERIKEFKKCADGVDDFGVLYFEDIDVEYEYKKFLQSHPIKYEDVVEYKEVDIIEYDITGRNDNPYIIPYRYLGKSDYIKDGSILYKYIPDAYAMAKEIASDLGLIEIEDYENKGNFEKLYWSVPTHSRKELMFVKINGEYLDYKRLPKFYEMDGTWEECYNKYKEHCKAIKEMFLLGIAKVDKKLNSKIDLCEFVNNLRELRNMIENLKVKVYKSSKYTPQSALNLVKKIENKIINKCESVLEEN